MKPRIIVVFAIVFILLVAGCGGGDTPTPTAVPPTDAPVPVDTQPPAVEFTAAPTDPDPTDAPPAGNEWPGAIAGEDDLSRSPVTAEEQATFDLLETLTFTENDPLALAVAIQGVPGPIDPVVATDAPTLSEGIVRSFWIHNTDTLEYTQIDARLERVTEHAYFWFDTTRELRDPTAYDRAAVAFENLYEIARSVYGFENNPGIDGDPHIYVMHASALALCDVDESTAHQCGLLGYFPTADTLPAVVNPHSNEHEMFVMNIDAGGIGGDAYASTLIHEFRHMIEHNYDRGDEGWEVEGSATFSQTLIGDYRDPGARGSAFTANTDIQLNAWTQGNSIPHYGKGYLLSRFIDHRLGREAFSTFVQHPDSGFLALDAVLQLFGYDFDAHDLWLDWMVAISMIGFAENADYNIPETYTFGDDPLFVDAPSMFTANKTKEFEDTVSQYGFDLYDVRGETTFTVDFTGATKVAMLENVLPASGQYMWWSGRANQSDMNLTREVDLTGVDSATLNYAVYHSIENAYDFAYLFVSTDGGETWETLVAENMQGEAYIDDPGGLALTDRFYTGNSRAWKQETVDLSPYAGQVVQIRFQYITDAIYTSPGLAVDNISIPEIGFYDDIETLDEGWVADGFARITAYVPQRFHVLVVTFDAAGIPTVTRIELDADNFASFEIPLTPDTKRAVVIVAASNPHIMSHPTYLLSFVEE